MYCVQKKVPIIEKTERNSLNFFFFVFCLVYLVVVFIVFGVEAIEDGSSKGEDGGSPGEAVAPVKLVVHPQADRLYELDGKQDQAAHLEHHCRGEQQREKGLM